MRRFISAAAVAWMVLLAALTANSVRAEEDPLALLNSYIGQWRGEGVLIGGEEPEPFRCRLTIAKGTAAKINYSGRCSLVNSNISISGTIAFNEANQRYEAAMSSNAGYTGLAVGRQSQGRITFDLLERQKDRAGSDVRIGAGIVLSNNTITVNFEIEFNDSGDVLTASVPFSN